MIEGKQIKQIRERLCETQTEFGVRFNVSKWAVSAWENGKRKPNRYVLKDMEVYFDL